MTEKVWCEVFQTPLGLEPIFFLGTRVEVSLWFDTDYQKEVREVFKTRNWVRENGEWGLVEPSSPLRSLSVHGLFVHLEDADIFYKQVVEFLKKRPNWKEPKRSKEFEVMLEKTKKATENYNISQISTILENAVEAVRAAPRETGRVKRRRADLTGLISAIQESIKEETSAATAELQEKSPPAFQTTVSNPRNWHEDICESPAGDFE